MKNLIKDISSVIVAAGKGTRSGLDYPKCLFQIKNKAILEHLLENFSFLGDETKIIVSLDGQQPIKEYLSKTNYKASTIIQKNQLGMGNAILQIDSISQSLKDHILLVWGDIPFIKRKTIESLIEHYFHENNDFALVTHHTKNPYTIVKRNAMGEIIRVIESHEIMNFQVDASDTEREIGLFLFKKDLVLRYLKMNLEGKFSKKSNEHGFLYVIQHLVNDGFKVGSVLATSAKESISFNSISDIKGLI